VTKKEKLSSQNDQALPYLQEIGLDHFYVGFEADELEDLKTLTRLPFCTHAKVKSGNDHWEGVYWSATTNVYFEMIQKSETFRYQLGLAFSANYIQYFDIRKIGNHFSGEDRLKTFRKLDARGKPWFDGLLPEKQKTSAIKSWAMHYHFCPRDRKMSGQPGPSAIERFNELVIESPPSLGLDLQKSIYWAPVMVKRNTQGFILKIRQKDQSDFVVRCRFNAKLTEVRFVSLKMQPSPFLTRLPRLKSFRLKRSQNHITLSRTP
jgi:hypothetical protein